MPAQRYGDDAAFGREIEMSGAGGWRFSLEEDHALAGRSGDANQSASIILRDLGESRNP
jgi:hypothetical protein